MSWSEVETAKKENRRELVLSGNAVSERITKSGLDLSIFNLTNLNYLAIHDTNLGKVPDEISKLVNLQTLALHSNKLTEITPKIAELEKLKVLDLSRNSLREIPEEFSKLLQLVTINLSFNQLESIPAFTENVKLTLVDVSNNKLKSFPDLCHSGLNLSELKLSKNEIEVLPPEISVLGSLKSLDLSHNKIKVIPGELVDCNKLKEVNFKDNPIADRRLLKLIDQCRIKQVLDYVKQHGTRTSSKTANASNKARKSSKNSISEDKNDVENDKTFLYTINVIHATDDGLQIIVEEAVKTVRAHIVGCVVAGLEFDEQTFKKFIQLQSKLHDNICDKRNAATIATHDAKKLAPGPLTYTALPPKELELQPLNRTTSMSGADLYAKLQSEAEALRKEKKRNVYSGVHKYLYLLEGQSKYPCLMDSSRKVISFPPITNSEISKISIETTNIFIEVTSSQGIGIAKKVMDTLLKEMVLLFRKSLTVQQVKNVDIDGNMKSVYPSRADLNFEDNVSINIKRE